MYGIETNRTSIWIDWQRSELKLAQYVPKRCRKSISPRVSQDFVDSHIVPWNSRNSIWAYAQRVKLRHAKAMNMNCKQCENQSRPNIYGAASISGSTWITALQTCELFSSYSAGYDRNVQAAFWYYSIKILLKPRTRRNSIKVEASTLHMLARCKNIA